MQNLSVEGKRNFVELMEVGMTIPDDVLPVFIEKMKAWKECLDYLELNGISGKGA